MTKSFDYENVFMGLPAERKAADFRNVHENDYRLRFLIEKVHLKRGRILDIGCGGGNLTESLTYYYPQAQVFGCDISKAAINLAKRHTRGKVKYDVIKNQKLPYKDDFFDVCLCLDVLEHIEDIHFFLAEVKRVIKKKGLFYLVVPCEGQPFTLTHFFQKIKIGSKLSFKHFGHIHPEFTHKHIYKLLSDYNFRVIDKVFSFHFLSQIITLFQYYLPKEILELSLGKKRAEAYYDRGIIQRSKTEENNGDLLLVVRKLLFKIAGLTKIIGDLETRFLQNVKLTSGKMYLIARNIK